MALSNQDAWGIKSQILERVLALATDITGLQGSRLSALDHFVDAGMNSMATVNLMLAIEAQFDLTIPDAEITPRNFANADSLATLVWKLIGSDQASGDQLRNVMLA